MSSRRQFFRGTGLLTAAVAGAGVARSALAALPEAVNRDGPNTGSPLAKNSPTALTFDLAMRGSSAPGTLHKFHCGLTVQSQ